MRNKAKLTAALLSGLMICGPVAQAEPQGPYSFGFSLGPPIAVGDTTNVLKNGFGFGMDFAYRKETSPLGIKLDMIYSNFALTSDVLNKINRADSGYGSIWGFDLSALLTPPNAGKVQPYIQGGPGFYYEYAEANRFQGNGGYVCDPWFGCYNVSSSETILDWSTWRLGWMGGAGININFDNGGALFFQAQYHRINNANANTEFMPIALGYRWSF